MVELTVGDLKVRLGGTGPYKARSAIDKDFHYKGGIITVEDWPYWYVTGSDGRTNILTFPDYPGAVLTDRHTAKKIVEIL